jgi:hypothetical protein
MRIIKIPHSGFVALTVTEFESSPVCDERIVCFNSQEVTVIRKALESFYWPTRYGEFITPGYFQIAPNGALLDVLREIEVKMSCNDLSNSIETLAASLERGLLAIANKPCCEDNTQIIINENGGVIGVTPSGQITYGVGEPILPPETYPEGYEDEEQYETQKCAIANGIVTGVVFTLDSLTAISSVNAIAATVGVILAAVPLIPVSPVLIPVLVPLVATCWLASGVLHAASVMVEENREELVCILISGDNISIIFEQLSDALDVMIATMAWSGPVAIAVKSLLMVLLNADTLNQLYGVFAGFMYPSADCSGCEEDSIIELTPTSELPGEGFISGYPVEFGTQFEVNAGQFGSPETGTWMIYLRNVSPVCYNIRIISFSGNWVPRGTTLMGDYPLQYTNCNGDVVTYSPGQTVPTGTDFELRSGFDLSLKGDVAGPTGEYSVTFEVNEL